MATTSRRIIAGSQLTTSAFAFYTARGDRRCVIKRLSLTNTSAGPVAATIYLVPSGASAAAYNTITSARSLAAGETWDCMSAEGHVIEAGGSVQALASVGAAITIIGSGVEIT